MNKKNKLFGMLVIIIFAMSILLSSCGTQIAETPAEEAAPVEEAVPTEVEAVPTEAEAVSTEAVMEEIPEQPVIVLQGVEVATLDPHFIVSSPDTSVNLHLFDALTRLDTETGEVTPRLADSWELIDDTTWRVYLRQDVTFQNGEAFNAEVAKYNLDRLIDPEINAQKWFFVRDGSYESCEVVDDYTIDIHTTAPSVTLPEALSITMMVPMGYYSSTPLEQLSTKPIGSGPYILKEWVVDDHLTMERWEDYWGDKPTIKTIIWRPVPELSTRISELVSGGADIIQNLAPDQIKQVEECDFCKVIGITGGRDMYLQIDVSFKPFDEVRARQALNYAVNKQAILDAFFQGNGKILAGVANSYWENTNLKPYPYDPEKALELFSEIGYTPGEDGMLQKDGQTISFTMFSPSGRYIKDKEIAQSITADLNAIGLDVTLETLEFGVFLNHLYTATAPPLYFLGLGGFINGIGEMRWTSPAPTWNEERDREFRWQSQEYEDLYEAAKSEMDRAKRKVIIDEMQAMVLEACPWVFLYKQYDTYGVNKRVVNWEPLINEQILLYGSDIVINGIR